MRRVSNGYTLLEVSIFLAISLVIATATWNLIGGKQEETTFNQKMRDTQSKLQDWINDVSTGNTGADPSTQSCAPSGGRPRVSGGGPSSTPYCIFLGKAIQFTDPSGPPNQDEEIYAYSVFGCRLKGCPLTPGPTDVEPTVLLDANPKAANGVGGGLDLTETFSLSPAHVSSVSSHLIGFFNSLNTQNAASSNGAEDINVYDFQFSSNDSKNGPQINSCLKLTAPCSPNPPALTSFTVCLTDGSHTAGITISSNGGVGAQTDLFYGPCP